MNQENNLSRFDRIKSNINNIQYIRHITSSLLSKEDMFDILDDIKFLVNLVEDPQGMFNDCAACAPNEDGQLCYDCFYGPNCD